MSFPSGYSHVQLTAPTGLRCTSIATKNTNVYFSDFGDSTLVRKIDALGTVTTLADPAFDVSSMFLFENTLFVGGLNGAIPTLKSIDITNSTITTYTVAGLALDVGRGNFFGTSTTSLYIADSTAHFVDLLTITGTTATVSQYSIAIPGNPSLAGIYGTGITTSDFMYFTASNNNIYQVAVNSILPPPIPATLMTISGATLNAPTDIVYAVDALYIADSGNNAIRRGTISGTTITITGSFTTSMSSPQAINFSVTSLLRFYVSNNGVSTGISSPSTAGTTIDKLYQTSGGSSVGGDPHIKGIKNNDTYILPVNNSVYNLFDNKDNTNRLIVNCQTQIYSFDKIMCVQELMKYLKTSGKEYINKYTKLIDNNPEIIDDSKIQVYDVSFLKYVSFNYKENYFVINMESLEIVTDDNTTLPDENNKFIKIHSITDSPKHYFPEYSENAKIRTIEIMTDIGGIYFYLYRLFDRLNFRNVVELEFELCFESVIKHNDKISGLLIDALDCKIIPSLNFVENFIGTSDNNEIKKITLQTLDDYKKTIVPIANKKRRELRKMITCIFELL